MPILAAAGPATPVQLEVGYSVTAASLCSPDHPEFTSDIRVELQTNKAGTLGFSSCVFTEHAKYVDLGQPGCSSSFF